ncbi:MAG: class A beta-lactamase-related serine hydrolase, partial [Chloroflexi bacterium]|nr:class A beta-lactamase-related serine hydrolase [Chloroflexota bacterium]
GRLDFQRLLVLEDEYVAYDLGTLARLGLEPEDRVSVEDAIAAMIVISDTPLALMVQDAAGANKVKDLVDAEGMTGTTQPRAPTRTTAADMARLLEVIAGGKGFTEASRVDMLSLLLQERIRAGIAPGIPAGTSLAHKSGNLEDATHDVGIVWGPSGPYVLAILSDQPWKFDPLVRVSRAVYEYFAGEASEPVVTATAVPRTTPLATPFH